LIRTTPFFVPMEWIAIERPGQFGKDRDLKFSGYDSEYGQGNWRIMWDWVGRQIPFIIACQIYEDGYYADSFVRQDLYRNLTKAARDVYDHDPEDVKSGLDYAIQNSPSTHLQDISLRRVILRRGWGFTGNDLVQIRSHADYWGGQLSPGKVPFHKPEYILKPHFAGWWDHDSIEDFWQSNKILQIKV
jgi:hypothetical protein